MDKQAIIEEIKKIRVQRNSVRKLEREIIGETKMIQPMVADASDLRSNLSKILPKHLVPSNVGDYRQVLSPFFYSVEFDFGVNPTYGPLFNQTSSFKVNQDSGFLLMGISRMWADNSGAGFKAPLALTIRDNQSTRQFNNTAFPIQTIGYLGEETVLATPLLLVPNASISITLTSWLDKDITFIGSGYHEFVFHGFRCNMNDTKLLAQQMLL